MPHVNDKNKLRILAQELGTPKRVLRAQNANGRFDIDSLPPGQYEFNGLLFRCLSTPRELNPWDWSVGRSFFDLQSYVTWGATLRDRFVLEASAPGRVAAYLLPFSRETVGAGVRIEGIPGLRIVSAIDDTILMKHLPTGGQLAIGEKPPAGTDRNWIASHLALELELVRDAPRTTPLYGNPSMSADEIDAYASFHSPSDLLSALAARIGMWWEHGAYTTLRSDRRNSTAGTLSWRESEGEGSIAELLTRTPIHVPGSSIVPGISANTNPYLCLGDESLELDWRVEPRLSLRESFARPSER